MLEEANKRDNQSLQAAEVWSNCAVALRRQVPEPTWNACIAPLVPKEARGTKFVLAAPSALVRDVVVTRFRELIQQTFADTTSLPPQDIEVVVESQLLPQEEEPSLPLQPVRQLDPGTPRPTAASPTFSHNPGPLTPVPSAKDEPNSPTTLNPRFSFEAFVVGASNRFAHAAAQRVAEEPAAAYNPLFIYGYSGLGKTHLLHAIGNYVRAHSPGLSVCYVSTETFLNDFIEAIRTKGQPAFKRRYRTHDLLLVDDVQLLENKEETQEEFFYTFNSLHEAQKQVVLSSDRSPRAIAKLEARLRSRFESGLMTDIQPPELETRLAILHKKAEGEVIPMPDDVLELIATHVKDNIRELEGAFIRLAARASIYRVPVTITLAQEVLSDLIAATAPRRVTAQRILQVTADAYGFTVEEVRGPSRNRPLVAARQMTMYLMREMTDLSFPLIAAELGNRDHSTVMYGWRKIGGMMRERADVLQRITDLTHTIKASE